MMRKFCVFVFFFTLLFASASFALDRFAYVTLDGMGNKWYIDTQTYERDTNTNIIVVPKSRTKKGRKRDLVKNVKDRIITRTFRVG